MTTNGWILLSHRHRAYADIDEEADILDALPPDILRGRRRPVRIENTGLLGGPKPIDWDALQEEQAEQLVQPGERLADLRQSGLGVAYFGRTLLSLGLDLGYRVQGWTKPLIFPYDRFKHVWGWREPDQETPSIEVAVDDDGLPGKPSTADAEVILRVSVTHRVAPEVTREHAPGAFEVDIGVGSACGHEALRGPADLEAVAQAFHHALTRVHERLPNTKRIHLFMAGPVGLAFRMGCLINHKVQPPILSYEYAQGAYQPALTLGQRRPREMKLKLQFLTAEPKGQASLRLGEEQRAIRDRLRDGERRDRFHELPEPRPAARRLDLQTYIRRDKAHILHFSGHGESDGALILEDAVGRPERVQPESLRMMIELWNDDGHLRCIVLNACHSDALAEVLVREPAVVPAAIGTTTKVPDDVAIGFSVGFYGALADGAPLGKAFRAGQIEVNQIDPKRLEDFQLRVAEPAMLDKPLFER